MGKILVIAEKPSVGRDIARVLQCKGKGDGCLIGDRYIVTWAVGHLVTLAEPEDYSPVYKKWSLDTLPILPESMKLKVISKTRKQYNVIKQLMNDKEVTSLICATDSGREGELIFRYIYQTAKCKKPFERLWISSMTDAAIREGFEKLQPGSCYDALYASARCRAEADWLVGMNASRAFTIQYHALLSIGRVQTPTLAMLVARQKEIDSFVPEDYWEVKGRFRQYEGIWFDGKDPGNSRISTEEKAEYIARRVQGQEGRVKDIRHTDKKQLPPLLYDLTELQRDANRSFGFSAQKTLFIAQDLYEKRKLITYPRTDSRYISHDIIPKLKGILKKVDLDPYHSYIGQILEMPKMPINGRIVNDDRVTDHHAIIPTETLPHLDKLSADEKKIYDLIVKRFIAVFLAEYKYKETRVITEAAGECFVTKGKSVVQWGWMTLYKDDARKNKEEEQELPELRVGDMVGAADTEILKKQTKPPNPYNEATLLSAMENAGRFIEDEELKEQLKESGLGTPATRAAIIERLIQVGYVERKGKALLPTKKGIQLIDIVPEELKSPEMTGKWEKGLSSISKGQMDAERFMGSIVRFVHYLVEQALQAKQEDVHFDKEEGRGRKKRRKAASSLGKCPLCKQGDVYENSKGYYCSQWKKGCKFTIWKNDFQKEGQEVTPDMVRRLLKEGRVIGGNV